VPVVVDVDKEMLVGDREQIRPALGETDDARDTVPENPL